MRAITIGVGAIATAFLFGLWGCGGNATPFSPMNNNLQQQFENAARPATTARSSMLPKVWDVKALLKPPLDVRLQNPKEETVDKVAVRVQEVSFADRHVKAGRIAGILTAPVPGEKPKRLPGILLIGDSVEAVAPVARHLAASGYVVLAPEIVASSKESGSSPLKEEAIFKARPLLQDSALYEMVARSLRAVSVLADQPNVDPRQIGVLGYSWGGIAACLLSALDRRVHAVSAILMPLAQEKIDWNDSVSKLGEDRDRWVLAYDPLSYLGELRQPMQFLADPSGKFYPVANIQRLRQDLRTPTSVLYRVASRDRKTAFEEEARVWFDSVLKTAPRLPSLKAQLDGKEAVSITAQGDGPLKTVTLYYALGNPMAFDGRAWKMVEARPEGNRWRAALPKEAIGQEMVYFAVAEEARGGAASTDMIPQINSSRPTADTPPLPGAAPGSPS